MKLSLKKAVVLGLSASLVLTAFSGCSKKNEFKANETVLTVNGEKVPAGVVKFAARYSQAKIEDLYYAYFGISDPFNKDLSGTGSTLGAEMKNDIMNEIANQMMQEQHMEEYGVSLSDEDKSAIKAAASEFIAANDAEALEAMAADQETVERYLELLVIENKMNEAMSKDVDTEVSDEEAAQRKVKMVSFDARDEMEEAVEDESELESESESELPAEDITPAEMAAQTEAETEKVTEAPAETEAVTEAPAKAETEKTTEAPAETEEETAAIESETAAKTKEAAETETAETESEAVSEAEPVEIIEEETEDPALAAAAEEARMKASNMISLVEAGQDFDEVAEQMGMTVDETTFGSDYYLPELVAATDGLEDGTLVSEPVQSGNTYYVVYLVSQIDREATDAEKESIVEQRKKDMIDEKIAEWSEAAEISADSKVLDKIDFYVSLSLAQDEEAEAESEFETE